MTIDGDATMARRRFPAPLSVAARVGQIVADQWNATLPPSGISQTSYDVAADVFTVELGKLRQLVEVDMKKVETALEAASGPWTPGRVPVWKR